MKKIIISSVLAGLIVPCIAQAEESVDKALKEGQVSGHVRLASIYNTPEQAGSADTFATAVGGIVKYETAEYKKIKLGAAGYISQKIPFLSGDKSEGKLNGDFFDDELRSFAYIGEAYLDYQRENIHFRIGRQVLDIPFADADDIRMNQNTFEAALLEYEVVENTSLTAGYITRWAGIDSGGDTSSFKPVSPNNGNGAFVLGITSEQNDALELQAWYYDIDYHTSIIYGEGAYTMDIGTRKLEIGAQAGRFSEEQGSNVDGDVIGLNAEFNMHPVKLFASYNQSFNDDGKWVDLGFGGGPYYTSMEEMTIAELNDAKAYRVGFDANFAHAQIPEMTLTYAYGHFENGAGTQEYVEHNAILKYEVEKSYDLELSYAMIDEKTSADATDDGYSRVLARVNYHF